MNSQLCEQPSEIIHVIHQAFKRYELDPIPSSALKETADSIQIELDEGTLIFGGYEEQQLIAVVKCAISTSELYFSRLAVLPSHQGQGIAKKLLYYVEQYAKDQNTPSIICKVRKSEEGNIQLYTKLGYSIIAEEMTVSKTGHSIPTVTMKKSLS